MQYLSLPDFIQMLRLGMEDGAADSGQAEQQVSGNNATPSPNAHGTTISMNSTAAGTQSHTVPPAAIKHDPEPAVKMEEAQEGQPAGGGDAAAIAAAPDAAAAAAPAALHQAGAATAPAAADAPTEPMQMGEQHWDGMDLDEEDGLGSDYPGVSRVPPCSSGGGGGAELGWQVALVVRLDAGGRPQADAKPAEQLLRTATELGELGGS